MQGYANMEGPPNVYYWAAEGLSVLRIEACMIGLAIATYMLFFREGRQAKATDDAPADTVAVQRPLRRTGGTSARVVRAAVLTVIVAFVALHIGRVPLVKEAVKLANRQPPIASMQPSSMPSLASWASKQSSEGGPAIVLSEALQSIEERMSSEAREALNACTEQFDADMDLAFATAAELCSQLACHSEANALHLRLAQRSAQVILTPSRQLLTVVGTLVMRCGALTREMEALQSQEQPHFSKHMGSSFRALRDLECPFRSAYLALASSVQYLELQATDDDPDAGEVLNHLLSVRSAARDSLLEAVRQARGLSMLVRRATPESRQALDCAPGLLGGIEDLAMTEARKEAEDHADTQFELGMYRSEASIVGGGAPCFRDSLSGSLARDAHGVFVPGDIAEAEDILLQAEQLSIEVEIPQRAASRALRLYAHANYLSRQLLDAAAEWRYRDAAAIALVQGYPGFASQSLSHLSAMLVTRGRRQEALHVASEALTHDVDDPLALYLQTSLRLSLGEFSTGVAVRDASKTLQALAGRLPWEALEAQRTMWEADLALWDAVADGTVWACMRLHDVAKVLICLVGKFTF